MKHDFEVAATCVGCVQVSPDDFVTTRDTKIFPATATFADIDAWAKEMNGQKSSWKNLILSYVKKASE